MTYICIYYNESKGYIITSYGVAKGIGYLLALYPSIALDCTANKKELANAIGEAIETSRAKAEVDPNEFKGKSFWDISGIKSFSAFSKKYKSVAVEILDDKVEIHKEIRDTQGAYMRSKLSEDNACLGINCSLEDITDAVIKLLSNTVNEKKDSSRSFKTLGGADVFYNESSADLVDCGDGGTDAYQIYEEPDTNNLIAFLIDNGYKSFGKDDIRTVLERQFGAFDEFRYDDLAKDHILVSAHNSKCRIESHIYHKEDDSVEVLCYTEEKSGIIDESYSEIINSITIEWK
ncbi:hypothetical protein [Butyrivibrio sp. INlla21]|uniref:hypothetical protein n=1 Tax=Butyrivibrio sp. INlla21 TaxID=1520811 RepID=UPI0008F42F72|nr:hypothetical protein [Butyrivibrio sp. INlla21]SFV01699.1 hypothetical protein SAMN02910342_02979 [Butyrivibrio sp. INlla21]